MKLLTVILSVYFLTLNLYPCGDTPTEEQVLLEVAEQIDGDQQQHDHMDLCSPFCHCHCCHVHAIKIATLFDQVKIYKPPTKLITPDPNLAKQIPFRVFQPPRLIG